MKTTPVFNMRTATRRQRAECHLVQPQLGINKGWCTWILVRQIYNKEYRETRVTAGNQLVLEVEIKDKYSPTNYPLGNSENSEDRILARIRSLAKLIQFCKEICTRKHVAESSAVSSATDCSGFTWHSEQGNPSRGPTVGTTTVLQSGHKVRKPKSQLSERSEEKNLCTVCILYCKEISVKYGKTILIIEIVILPAPGLETCNIQAHFHPDPRPRSGLADEGYIPTRDRDWNCQLSPIQAHTA